MSGERYRTRTGEAAGGRQGDDKFGGCITDAGLQGMADGTLRGPERFLVQQHVDECPRCSADLAVYEGLCGELDKLRSPQLPPGFTTLVLAAVEQREAVRDERHRALVSALPAALIALGVLLLWAFFGEAARLHDVVIGATVAERVFKATFSVMQAARLPLGLGALVASVAVFAALARTVAATRAAIARS